jgi:hypothetical protein
MISRGDKMEDHITDEKYRDPDDQPKDYVVEDTTKEDRQAELDRAIIGIGSTMGIDKLLELIAMDLKRK